MLNKHIRKIRYTQFKSVADPDLELKGGPHHPNIFLGGGKSLKKEFFTKNNEGAQAPSPRSATANVSNQQDADWLLDFISKGEEKVVEDQEGTDNILFLGSWLASMTKFASLVACTCPALISSLDFFYINLMH